MGRRCFALLLCTLALSTACGVRNAGNKPESAEQRGLRIERSLACPQCTDLALDVCDQDICNDMRALLQQKIVAGESDEAIRDFFVERYGARVLLVPPKNSSTWLAWLVPFIVLLAGAGATAGFLRAAARQREKQAPVLNSSAVSAELRARAERELREVE